MELFKNLRINWPLPIIRKSLRFWNYKLWKNGRNFLQLYLFSTCTYAYWWHCKLNDRDMHTYSIVSVRDIKEEERFSMWMKNNVLSRNQLKPIIFDILFFQFMRVKDSMIHHAESVYIYAKMTIIHYPAIFLLCLVANNWNNVTPHM